MAVIVVDGRDSDGFLNHTENGSEEANDTVRAGSRNRLNQPFIPAICMT